jgi:hypothetical protein
MTSNRSDQFGWFLDQLEASTGDKSCVEVVVKIDASDAEMNELLPREVARRPFKIRYISTPLPDGFFSLWQSFDELLRITDPSAYFVINLNDEMCFDRPNWDDALRRYVGLFPDHIFRLRSSQFRFRNYYDFWEVGWSNDTSSFMTKRWLDIGGGWCPCNGPDTFQQYVAYYFGWLQRFNWARPQREIPINDVGFRGHGASQTLSGEALRRRRGASIAPWFILLSHKMQEDAARRAMRLYSYIWAEEHGLKSFQVHDRLRDKSIEVADQWNNVLLRTSYRLSRSRIGFFNAIRRFNWAYYGGAGDAWKGRVWDNALEYFCLRYPRLDRLSEKIAARRSRLAKAVRGIRQSVRSQASLFKRGLKKLIRMVNRFATPVAAPGPEHVTSMTKPATPHLRAPSVHSLSVPMPDLRGALSGIHKLKEFVRHALRDLRQVHRESAGPPSPNRRLRYRIAWIVFRASSRIGLTGRPGYARKTSDI